MSSPEAVIEDFFRDTSPLSTISSIAQQLVSDSLAAYTPRTETDRTRSVLESFIEFLPTEGSSALSSLIADHPGDEFLFKLANHLRSAIILPMKTRTPTPIIASPAPDYDLEVSQVAMRMEESPTRSFQQQLKQQCLLRDNYTCMITTATDSSAPFPSVTRARLELAHIIPFSMAHWNGSPQSHQIAQIWATLLRCFPRLRLRSNDINHPKNLMTLLSVAHQAFGEFKLALEPVSPEANTYKILEFGEGFNLLGMIMPENRMVTLTKRSEDDVDLPSPYILEAHACLSKILHASGEGERIEQIFREREEIRCLAEDGSTNVENLLLI
ncbi:hypothetical protein FQN57_005617 [Myotisia sp. PD_48]|nr:hypothetical protein FQN57_005617 [Myotisia sp. PD_48]